MSKPRIADLRIRAAIEGPFTGIFTTAKNAALLDAAARKAGILSVLYQHRYLCLSGHGDPDSFKGIVVGLARALGIRVKVVARNTENMVEAVMSCHEHLASRNVEKARDIARPGFVAAQNRRPR
jgi:hypothetical protein